MTSVWRRWLPAAVAAPVVIVAGVLVAPLAAGAAPTLPSKTPHQVLELALTSTVETFSGTVKQSSDLGLPDLPSTGPSTDSGAASSLELLTGSHTARVYSDGPTKQRVQVLDTLAERDAIRNGNDVWLYDSNANDATHVTLPDHGSDQGTGQTPGEILTPDQLAQQILTKLDPSTALSTDKNVSIAGRSAYELVLTPKAKDTLIGSVSIAVDSGTGLPLRVDVQAKGQNDPAFELAFSSLSLETPAASLFDFSPPKSATVTQQTLPEKSGSTAAPATGPTPTVIGSGWDAIVELPAGSAPSALTSDPLYSELTTPVIGGRILGTSVVSVFIADDGRVFAGSVPVGALQAAAQ